MVTLTLPAPDTDGTRTRRTALAMVRTGCLCEYCETAPADGVVSPSWNVVCEDCYEDHHGGGL